MPRRSALPPALSTGPFTVAAAAAAGVRAGRLRGSDLARPFHGVRMVRTGAQDLFALCTAKLLTMRPGQVFSHVTACRLLGIPVPRHLVDDRIDVADFLPAALPRGRGVRGHRLSPRGVQLTTVGRLPVVAAEDAWCQLAALASHRELVVAGDALLRRHAPLADPVRILLAVERRAGRRGHRALVRAADEIRAGTDSPQETLLRLDLVAAGLPEPEVNPRILDADGSFLGIGDLAYEQWRVLVEYDGQQHRTDDRQFARDLDRLDDFARAGWRVIRFTKQHRGERRARQIERVREALVLAGWRPGA